MFIFSFIYKFTMWLFMVAFIINTIFVVFKKEGKNEKRK